MILPQPARVVQLRSPQMVPSPPILSLPARVVTMPALSQDRRHPAVTMAFPAITQPMVAVNLRNAAADGDVSVGSFDAAPPCGGKTVSLHWLCSLSHQGPSPLHRGAAL